MRQEEAPKSLILLLAVEQVFVGLDSLDESNRTIRAALPRKLVQHPLNHVVVGALFLVTVPDKDGMSFHGQ